MKDDKNNLIYLDYNGQTIFRTMHLTEPDGWLSPPTQFPTVAILNFISNKTKGPSVLHLNSLNTLNLGEF